MDGSNGLGHWQLVSDYGWEVDLVELEARWLFYWQKFKHKCGYNYRKCEDGYESYQRKPST